MSIKRIIAIVIGLIIIGLGVKSVVSGSKGPGDIEVFRGPLSLEEGATDAGFDIYVESPVLIRKVEMYQYVLINDKLQKEFRDEQQPDCRVNPFSLAVPKGEGANSENLVTYRNPSFPKEPESEIFLGKVKMGDSGLYLNDKVVEKLSIEQYTDFEEEHKLLQVSGLMDKESYFDMYPLNDSAYGYKGSGKNERWEIGDVRVIWQAVDPSILSKTYTVAGKATGDTIENQKDRVFFYDHPMTPKDIEEQYEKTSKTGGIVAFVIGGIILAFAILPKILKK